MTANPKPKGKSRPQAYSKEIKLMAFKTWLDNGRPAMRELSKIIEAQSGLALDFSTLSQWSRRMPDWAAAILEAKTVDPEKVIAALASAKADANQLEADHFIGIKAQLVARLYESVKELPLLTVDDWDRALTCCDRIEALIHTERGRAVTEKGGCVVSSLMERLAPNVSLAPFKKPQTNGAGH